MPQIFPGIYGPGSTAVCGRGGDFLVVSSLADSGPGTLREALEVATGPRTVLFAVSGYIELEDWISIEDPFISVLGATGPWPGICFKDYGIRVRTHDVFLQHLRGRTGDKVAFYRYDTVATNGSPILTSNGANLFRQNLVGKPIKDENEPGVVPDNVIVGGVFDADHLIMVSSITGLPVNAIGTLGAPRYFGVGEYGTSNGPAGSSDCIEIIANERDVYNVVVDRCSFSWATDEVFSIYAPDTDFRAYNIIVSNCNISEALTLGHSNPAGHSGDGILIGSTNGTSQLDILFINNLFAQNNARNPTSQSGRLHIVNNLVYNWGGKLILLRYEDGPDPVGTNIVGNIFQAGPSTLINPNRQIIEIDGPGGDASGWPPGSYVHYGGNAELRIDGTALLGGDFGMRLADNDYPSASSPQDFPSDVTVKPTQGLEAYILRHCGAMAGARDAVDARICAATAARLPAKDTGYVDYPDEVGGYPVLVEREQMPFIPSRPWAAGIGGYTRFENHYHRLHKRVSGEGISTQS